MHSLPICIAASMIGIVMPLHGNAGAPAEAVSQDNATVLKRYVGYRSAIQEARRLVNERQFVAARKVLQPCLAAIPDHWEAHYLLAQMAYEERKVEEALSNVEEAERSLLKLEQLRRAELEAAKARDAALEVDLQNSLAQVDWTLAEGHGCMGGEITVRQHALNDQRMKMGSANDDTSGQPVPAELYLLHGNSLYRLKRYVEAKEKYQQAIQVDPSGPNAWNNLIGVYLEQREIEQAKVWLVRARKAQVALRPELVKAIPE